MDDGRPTIRDDGMTSSLVHLAEPDMKGPLQIFLPGVLVSALIAAAGYFLSPYVSRIVPIPAIVIALVIGIALNPIATGPITEPGRAFCVKNLLRWAVALLGLRVALNDIVALGTHTALLIVASMALTLLSGFLFAHWNGQQKGFGALVGAGVAVCGASATLATSTVVPEYPGKQEDIAFTVVAVNALATVAMIFYPPICVFLGFDGPTTGVMLGGTIHDVAQVAGAGYALSEDVGNAAVIAKLFRVFLLLPVVVCIGAYFTSIGAKHDRAQVPVPVFALVFLALCALNSMAPLLPTLSAGYEPIKRILIDLSNWGLLMAIAALGFGTSIKAMICLGWRHAATILGSSAVLLIVVTAGLWMDKIG